MALRHWQAAGDQAMAHSAVRESATHCEAAGALLDAAPAVESRAEVELDLRLRLNSGRRRARALFEGHQ